MNRAAKSTGLSLGPLSRRALCLFALLFLATGCGKGQPAADNVPNLTPPTDEATRQQRALIDSTLTNIEATTSALGSPHTFRTLPVLVTSDTKYISEAKGACVKSGGHPQFILLRPAVLDFESHLPADSETTSLFPVLLHEIGHCYFSREHDDALIRSSGFEISFSSKHGETAIDERAESLDASVMSPDKLLMPIALSRYYVAEVMGQVRHRTLEAVAAHASPKTHVSYVKILKP